MKAINEKTKKWTALVDKIKFFNHKEHTDRLMSGIVSARGGILAFIGEAIQAAYKNLTDEQAQDWAKYVLKTKITCKCGACKNRRFFKNGREVPTSF